MLYLSMHKRKAGYQNEENKIISFTNINESGNNTEDKVFLLSDAQEREYFGLAARWSSTLYAQEKGAPPDQTWLSAWVRNETFDTKFNDYSEKRGIRPAMWLKIN